MTYEPGSKEHKDQYCQDLIKAYYENIWNDEIYRSRKEVETEFWQKELAGIESKIERKEFKTKNEASKAKFVAERELKMVTDKIAELTQKRAFMENRFPVKLLRAVHREYFVAPSYEEFREKTVWSLENAFTTAFKELKPQQQYQATAKLGKFRIRLFS
jgi:hypothetical protein